MDSMGQWLLAIKWASGGHILFANIMKFVQLIRDSHAHRKMWPAGLKSIFPVGCVSRLPGARSEIMPMTTPKMPNKFF